MVRTSHQGDLINLIIRCPGYLLRLCVERRLVARHLTFGMVFGCMEPPSILDKKAKSVLEPNSEWSQNLSCFIRLLKPRPLDQQSSLATISLVVQRLHKAIQWINCYPADEFNKTHYTIHWIQIFPVDSIILPLNNNWATTSLMGTPDKLVLFA